MKICKVNGCDNIIYAKELCRNHYNRQIKTGDWRTLRQIHGTCRNSNCNGIGKNDGLCDKHHKLKEKYGVELDSYVGICLRGKNNPNWNGGVADYKDHWGFKKNRLIRIEQENGKCQKCGLDYEHVHHIDGSKDNHAIDNLMVLCKKCHYSIHAGRKNSKSKILDTFGMSAEDIASILNVKTNVINGLFARDRDRIQVEGDNILVVLKTCKSKIVTEYISKSKKSVIKRETKVLTKQWVIETEHFS